MNKRIKSLIEQATTEVYSGPGEIMEFDQEKFAELLIRECARVASDYDGAHYVGTAIEQHFGVE